MEGQFKQPPEMDFSHEGNLSEKWKRWKQTMNLYLEVALSEKTEKEKCKALLYVIGLDGREIFNTFNFEEGENDKLDVLLKKYEDYCIPKTNVTVIRHRFNTRVQGPNESIDQYLTELKLIAKNCEFEHLKDGLIRDRIVCGTNSQRVKERLLREDNLTLVKAVSVCRAEEESRKQIKTLNDEETVHALRKKKFPKQGGFKKEENPKNPGQRKQHKSQDSSFNCGKCGTKHQKKQCPAFGKTCYNCQKPNHFKKQCRSKQSRRNVHNLQENSDSEDEENFFVGSIDKKTEICEDSCFTTYKIQGKTIKFKIDTGSQVNILPLSIYDKLSNVKLSKTKTTLTSYSGDKLKVAGKCTLQLQKKNLEFFVTNTDQYPLLGFKASNELGLIQVVMTVKSDIDDPIKAYPKVFTGLGCLEKPYHIKIDTSVTPVINPPRKIPTALRDKLKSTLNDMEEKGVIRKVDEPTDWVNSLVVVEKPKTGKLRVCLDPRNLNLAIHREHYQLPTIEDITARMSGARFMSKLDCNHGYWQIRIDKQSQLLTTFNSPFGRYCFLRMPFGIKSAQEVFQKRVTQLFEGLDGVETDIDDILVWGKTREEHDNRLRAVLNKCQEVGLTLNAEKCKFRMKEITYIGHTLSAEGVRPDKEKIKAITEMPAPVDKKGVQRLLGTVNYLAKFVPNMSIVTEPIRSLLKEENDFIWTHEQTVAFEKIKEILTSDPVLRYFDVGKPITVSCDASQSGLGAVLLQQDKPVAFVSRSLTDAESRYANIERELLAVLFGLERFHQYTYGRNVTVESDHKPLESIVRKSLGNSPPRLQRMLLRLQKYDFQLVYKPGKDLMVPDMLSRASLITNEDNSVDDDIECFVNMVIKNMPVSDKKLEQIKSETTKDESLMIVKTLIHNGWPSKRENVPKKAQEYWLFKNELSETNGLILKGEKIVIPASMRKEMLIKLHESHLGIEKTKKLARDFIFWPGMNSQIADCVTKCGICLENRNSNQKEPMTMSEIPELPWNMVGTDLFYWDNNNYLIIVDYYSRYFEVAKLENTRTSCVISHMKSIFARHGIPQTVRSDCGPQYTSSEFREFAENWGFNHQKSSPNYQQSNGLAERFVQSVKKLLQKAKQDGKDPYLSLLAYRNTPMDNVGSPAQLLMNRRLRSQIPTTQKQLIPKCKKLQVTKDNLKKTKLKQKHYYDRNAKSLNKIERNESIRFQKEKGGKWNPGKVINLDEQFPKSYHVITPEGAEYRRNRRHIIKTDEEFEDVNIETSEIEEVLENSKSVKEKREPLPILAKEKRPYTTRGGRPVNIPKRFQD